MGIWAENWPGLQRLAPLPGGARAEVWRAVDAAGGQWVLKTTRHSEAALAWLEPVQRLAEAAGFIVPRLRRSPAGLWAPGGVSCEPFLPGRAATAQDLPGLAPRLAAFQAQAAALPPRPGLAGTGEAPAFSKGLPADLEDDLAACLRAALAPMATAPLGAIHGDITPANVILTASGPALIDWDEARRDWLFLDAIATRPATPAEARAALAVEILSCWAPEPERALRLSARLRPGGQ